MRFRERDSKLFVDSCHLHFEPPLGLTLFKFNQDHWRELIDSFGHVRRCLVILRLAVLAQSRLVMERYGQTDKQTDRRTDGWTTAYTGRAGIMSRGKHYTQRPNDTKQVIASGAVRRYATADGSSTRGGSTSVRGRVRSRHMAKFSCRQPTCLWLTAAARLGQLRHGTDRRTDRGIA